MIKNKKNAKRVTLNKGWIAAIVLLLLVAFGSYWAIAKNHQNKVVATTNQKTATKDKTTAPAVVKQIPASSNTNSTTSQSPDVGSNTDATLVAPTGNSVSDHNVTSSQTVESVCTTTVGATCQITFTNQGSSIISLPPETINSGGSAYWTWTPSSIGLTDGNWKIQQKATLGSQTEATTDPLSLEVSQ